MTPPVYHELGPDETARLTDNCLHAFTDGSCYPNPGPGGWAVRMIWNGKYRDFYGGAPGQTNNTMELEGIKQALQRRTRPEVSMVVYTDSKYAKSCVSQWWRGWERNGWLTSQGKPVKNVELIRSIVPLVTSNVEFRWVKGHAGNTHNEAVDALALKGRKEFGGA